MKIAAEGDARLIDNGPVEPPGREKLFKRKNRGGESQIPLEEKKKRSLAEFSRTQRLSNNLSMEKRDKLDN